MVRVEIDTAKCLGNGMCAALVPTVFAVDDYGESSVEEPHPPEELHELVVEAVHSCPAQAIQLISTP